MCHREGLRRLELKGGRGGQGIENFFIKANHRQDKVKLKK